jgi:hypothetical protein
MAEILIDIRRPDLDARSAAFDGARWLTWSPRFRAALAEHRARGRRLRPFLRYISRRREYAYTFDVSLRSLMRTAMVVDLTPFVDTLLRRNPREKIAFLTGLDCRGEGWRLHTLFALLRALIAHRTGNPWGVMYAPLASLGKSEGEFPLHADLYRPEVLLNVFDAIPADGSGRSILLPMRQFLPIVRKLPEMPRRVRQRLLQALRTPADQDRYDEVYDLLHGPYPWSGPLNDALRRRQLAIALGRGEGYLVHDRRWLHGREAPTGGVTVSRLRRLIYTPH